MKTKAFLILLVVLSVGAKAQQTPLPLHRDFYLRADKQTAAKNNDFHTGFKPYIKSRFAQTDSLFSEHKTGVFFLRKKPNSLVARKLRKEHLIRIDTSGFRLKINPLFDLRYGKNTFSDQKIAYNTRGINIEGSIGKNFSFYTDFYENQIFFNDYQSQFINQRGIAPGRGLVKPFGSGGFDFGHASGLISYSPSPIFNFQFGHGKNFVGDGYRSLLLSDNAFNYPYFKITTQIWKIHYVNLFASFINKNAPHTYQSGYQKKFGTFHYLSVNLGKALQVSFFESIIWQGGDSTGTRGFDMNYLNPVIFYRPVEFSLGSPDNALLGLNLKWKITNKITAYGQIAVDDFDRGLSKGKQGFIWNKYGFQAGIKTFDIFGLKGLHFQTEYNQVRPYTYGHRTPLQNYSHYFQALAHPLGANFRESVSFIDFIRNDWQLSLQLNYAQYGADTSQSHWGKNIFRTEYDAALGTPATPNAPDDAGYGNQLLQGEKTDLIFARLQASFLINPKTNLKIFAGATFRSTKNSLYHAKSNSVYIGIKTALFNSYSDF